MTDELTVDEMEPLDVELLQQFVGDAADSLESALDGLANGAPLFVWPGNLRFDGNVSSQDLLAQCPGFEPPVGHTASERAFTMFIRGTVEVAGVLEIAQYHDVFVQRDVRAGSIVGHTGNLVVRGNLSAREVIAFECNEEGGFLHAASCEAPLLCRFGRGGWEWAVSNRSGQEIWEISEDPDCVRLRAALAQLGVDQSLRGIRDVLASGRAAELLGAL